MLCRVIRVALLLSPKFIILVGLVHSMEIPVARVNYVLRAVKVPAGQHTLVLTFRPSSVSTTEIIAYLTLALLALGFAFALWQSFRSQKGKAEETA